MATKRDNDEPDKADSAADRVITQPYGPRSDSKPPPAPTDEPPSEEKYDPFRSGLNEYPTDLFKKLITADIPLVPKEELFETRPPNVRFATPGLSDASHAPDPLPAVESPDSVAVPIRSRRNLAVAVVAVVALLLGAVVLARPPSQPKQSTSASPADTPTTATRPEPSLPTAVITDLAPTQRSAQSAEPGLPNADPPRPVRVQDANASAGAPRPTVQPHSAVSRPPVSTPPQATPKPSGLDSAEFPKPD